MDEKQLALAPGRLSALLKGGLSGHHPLFELEAIREAFSAVEEDRAVSADEADEVGSALLSIASDPLPRARLAVEGLRPSAREALIRLYFRLLDQAEEAQVRH